MLSNWFGILALVGALSSFIPVVSLVLWKSRIANTKLWIAIFSLSLCWLIAEVLNYILAFQGIDNIWVFHSYDIISTLLYLHLFTIILLGRSVNLFMMLLALFYVVTVSIFYFAAGSFTVPNTYTMILTMLIPFVLSVYYFFYTARYSKENRLTDSPVYWINCAILIHFGISLFVNISYEFILESINLQHYLWPIIIITNIIHNILISVSAWKMKQT